MHLTPAPARRRGPGPAISLLLVVAAIAAGCATTAAPTATPGSSPGATGGPSQTPAPTATPAEAGALVSVELRGGHCVSGTCGSTVVLDTDGSVRTADKPPNELGTVPASDVTGLTDLIAQTDFTAIKAKPFTGTCPMAFDGQEVVYEFTTAAGVERIESCTTEVDPKHPLFEAVAGVLIDFVQIPEY